MTDPTFLLRAHRAALLAMIAANNAAPADRAGRIMLDGLNARARRWIGKIGRDLGSTLIPTGVWGENGAAPSIRALIREAGRVREMAVPRVEEAA